METDRGARAFEVAEPPLGHFSLIFGEQLLFLAASFQVCGRAVPSEPEEGWKTFNGEEGEASMEAREAEVV